jgi:hypothetical protein
VSSFSQQTVELVVDRTTDRQIRTATWRMWELRTDWTIPLSDLSETNFTLLLWLHLKNRIMIVGRPADRWTFEFFICSFELSILPHKIVGEADSTPRWCPVEHWTLHGF